MAGTVERNSESGVTLLEVMISSLFLTIALLGIAMTMVAGISSMYHTQEQLIAKQKAREALESVFTARSTQNVLFVQLQNTTAEDGIFLTGYQAIRGMGTDGIANTADDSLTAIETLTFPGADGQLGNADDEIWPLTGYERKVTITDVLDSDGDVDPDIRQITVEVRFQLNKVWQTVLVSTYVSRFA